MEALQLTALRRGCPPPAAATVATAAESCDDPRSAGACRRNGGGAHDLGVPRQPGAFSHEAAPVRDWHPGAWRACAPARREGTSQASNPVLRWLPPNGGMPLFPSFTGRPGRVGVAAPGHYSEQGRRQQGAPASAAFAATLQDCCRLRIAAACNNNSTSLSRRALGLSSTRMWRMPSTP